MQPSHNILDDILTGVGLSSFSVVNMALHKRHTFRYRLLVSITSVLCLIRASMSFVDAWSLYHAGKPWTVPFLYVLGALIALFLSIQVFASSGAIIANLKVRQDEQIRDEHFSTINAANLEKSDRMVTEQQGGQ